MEAKTQRSLRIDGMTCAGCVSRVTGALERLPGTSDVRVDLDRGRATLTASDNLDSEDLVGAVKRAGFGASPIEHGQSESSSSDSSHADHDHDAHDHGNHRGSAVARSWLWRAIVGLAAATVLMTLHMGGWLHDWTATDPLIIASLALATIVQVLVGWGFYRGAWRALRAATANMDTLIALGATAAYALSVWVIVGDAVGSRPDAPLYLGEPAGIMGLISLGHYLEARLTHQAGSVVRDLFAMQPERVTRLKDEDNTEGDTVAIEDVQPGDLVRVRPGEAVPVDGVIVKGDSSVQLAHLTGESMPTDIGEGDDVPAGATNGSGVLVVRATSSGRSTSIARLAEAVDDAQSRRVGVQRLADRIAAVFTVCVVIIAAFTLAGWALAGHTVEGTVYAASVLIIACPCALGIATPAAVMVGVGAAAKRGILVRTPEVFERLRDTTHLVLDKTGTLTAGRPKVLDPDDDLLRIAAALATVSSHPLSRAIVREAHARDLDFKQATDAREHSGRGLTGTLDGDRLELCSLKAARELGHDIDAGDDTCVVLLRNDEPVGVIRFHDPLREGAADFVREQKQHREVILLTGDHERAARSVAEACAIDNWHADQSPEDKANAVGDLIDNGGRPVFVGDGVNDTPALARADSGGGVAVAVGTGRRAQNGDGDDHDHDDNDVTGTQAAASTARVVLVEPSPKTLASLFSIATRTRAVIAQNLGFALVYNALAIPAAAFGLLGMHGPLIAAGAMAASDLCVAANALRLRWVLRRTNTDTPHTD